MRTPATERLWLFCPRRLSNELPTLLNAPTHYKVINKKDKCITYRLSGDRSQRRGLTEWQIGFPLFSSCWHSSLLLSAMLLCSNNHMSQKKVMALIYATLMANSNYPQFDTEKVDGCSMDKSIIWFKYEGKNYQLVIVEV